MRNIYFLIITLTLVTTVQIGFAEEIKCAVRNLEKIASIPALGWYSVTKSSEQEFVLVDYKANVVFANSMGDIHGRYNAGTWINMPAAALADGGAVTSREPTIGPTNPINAKIFFINRDGSIRKEIDDERFSGGHWVAFPEGSVLLTLGTDVLILDKNGNTKKDFKFPENQHQFGSVKVLKNGTIGLMASEKILSIDSEGNILSEIPTPNRVNNFLELSDGTFIVWNSKELTFISADGTKLGGFHAPSGEINSDVMELKSGEIIFTVEMKALADSRRYENTLFLIGDYGKTTQRVHFEVSHLSSATPVTLLQDSRCIVVGGRNKIYFFDDNLNLITHLQDYNGRYITPLENGSVLILPTEDGAGLFKVEK